MKSVAIYILILLPIPSWAHYFHIDENTVQVGKTTTQVLKQGDTLEGIARFHHLGIDNIRNANPNTPLQAHQVILIPKQFILPQTPRKGIVINLPEKRLYYYPSPTEVYIFPAAIGTDENPTPQKAFAVSDKHKKPVWHIPNSVRKTEKEKGNNLPNVIPPGEENPLGHFSMRLSGSSYLIHGTNNPNKVGTQSTHGCISLRNEDIKELYYRTPVNTPVTIINQPIKFISQDNRIFLEKHPSLSSGDSSSEAPHITSYPATGIPQEIAA